jgi:anti-sigma factor RsiW
MADSIHNSNLDDELLSAYIDGELTDGERAAVEARLENDPAARELVAEMRILSSTLKSLPRERIGEDLRAAVLSQIADKRVALPPVRLSMTRRFLWPAIAIAAALMLMFVQDNRDREPEEIARVDDRVADAPGDGRGRRIEADREAAFVARDEEAPALDAAAAPAVPATGDRLMVADADAPEAESAAGTVLREAVDDSAMAARRITDAMAATDAELEGVVHLTLTDFRSGTERFNRLLLSNGVQLVDEQVAAAEPASAAAPATAAPATDAFGAADRISGTMSTRSATPTGGVGGAMPNAPAEGSSAESEPEPAEPEMVLVEAPPEQIEQILFGCAQDTEAIEEVTVDPTASGMNNAPAKQRLSDYQQYSRSSGKLALGGEYKVTPQQQSAIAVFNSLPKQAEAEPPSHENQQQQLGWAARFYANEQPVQAQELNSQYNQYRDQYFYSQARQQQAVTKGESVDLTKKLAKDKVAPEQPLRVLFLLHPSQEAAKK